MIEYYSAVNISVTETNACFLTLCQNYSDIAFLKDELNLLYQLLLIAARGRLNF